MIHFMVRDVNPHFWDDLGEKLYMTVLQTKDDKKDY